jgi:hypothetical protein
MNDVTDNWNPADKLGRKESADFLTNYLTKRYNLASEHGHADTVVLNIRADWGFGKTFFLQRWAKDLEQSQFPVVFFNAWENDFCDDPLIGFIAEINEALSNHFKEIPLAQRHLDKALAVGRKLIKPVSLGVASVIAKQLSGYSIEKLSELYSQNDDDSDDDEKKSEGEISSLISKCAEVALKEHLDTKATMVLFKKQLSRLIEFLEKEEKIELPLFVFIDELDRCRPTYAIELLEAVKHLFGVPGVYFVIATNLEQLGHSIRAVYGEQFDSERYLKRFFDQEYLLPSPDNARFTAFLFERYSLNDFGKFYTVIEDGVYGMPSDQVLFSIFSDSFKLGPRDQEQIAGTVQAVLLNWPKGERVHFSYLLFLIIAKHVSTLLFQQLTEKRLVDKAGFTEALRNVLRLDSTFKTHDLENNGTIVKNHTVLNLLWTYQSLARKSYGEILKTDWNYIQFPDKITYMVCQDAPRQWSGSEPPISLSDYARRVSQAGQLISVAKA